MPKFVEADDFNPKEVYDELMNRIKQTKEWFVTCFVAEEWIPIGKELPFEVFVRDGIFICRVICPTYTEAQKIVSDNLPVIKFIEEPDE